MNHIYWPIELLRQHDLALAAAGRGAGLLGGAVEGEQAEVKGLAIRQPSPEQERPDRGCDRAFGISGARDRARTGDPHVGKEMLGLIPLRFFAQSGHIDAFRSIVGEKGAAEGLRLLPSNGVVTFDLSLTGPFGKRLFSSSWGTRRS
jgi:hypothetical protein